MLPQPVCCTLNGWKAQGLQLLELQAVHVLRQAFVVAIPDVTVTQARTVRIRWLASHAVAMTLYLLLIAIPGTDAGKHDSTCIRTSAHSQVAQFLVPLRCRLPGILSLALGGDTHDQNRFVQILWQPLGRFSERKCLGNAARNEYSQEPRYGSMEHNLIEAPIHATAVSGWLSHELMWPWVFSSHQLESLHSTISENGGDGHPPLSRGLSCFSGGASGSGLEPGLRSRLRKAQVLLAQPR